MLTRILALLTIFTVALLMGAAAAKADVVKLKDGTTIEGVHELEKGGLRAALISAVRAATEKSRKLGHR